MLLEEKHVAGLVRVLRGEVHADVVARLQPIAGEAEIRPLGELEPQNFLVEVLGALEVLGDEKIMVQFGDRHNVALRKGCRAYFASARLLSTSTVRNDQKT
jgi:hypothetical protein